jgi:CDP-glycerol glycerophosphotransferase (TagB/SpsB family)
MKKRLLDSKFATEDKIEVIGYPKFDIIEQKPLPKPIFNNGKPTILYAPHFKKAESSWINFGIDVLDFFEHNTDYNLIFAPHILLYKRGWRHGAKSLRSYETCENIYIDTGSDASIDMTYTRQADIYLGDMSSQVYEFLHTLKPCIFLNAHAVTNWENDETYLHWLMGDVIDTIDDLEPALKKALSGMLR